MSRIFLKTKYTGDEVLLSHCTTLAILFPPIINTNKPAGYAEDGRVVEKGRELLGVEGGGGDEKLEIASEADDVLHQTEQYVRVKGALVCLVCVAQQKPLVLSTQ